MPQLLWVSPFSLHDRASAPARQLLNMVRSVKMLQPNLEMAVLCPTVYETNDPYNLTPAIRNSLLNLQSNTLIVENGIKFFYVKTHFTDFTLMPALDQRAFVGEITPLFHSLKPDVVVVHNCDVLSLFALNLAKQCKLKTAFVLNNYVPDYFRFADVDVILSTSKELVEYCVPGDLRKPVVQLGAFMMAHGPLNQSVIMAKARAAQKARERAAALQGKPYDFQSEANAAAIAAIESAPDRYVPYNQRRKVMLVGPSIENGLSIFLELYLRRKNSSDLKHAEFVVLEQQRNQFMTAFYQYRRPERPEIPAYDIKQFTELRVIPPNDDREGQLRDELMNCRVLVMPTLYSVLTCEAQIEALSYGARVITTEQRTLQEFLGQMATYIDVEQSLVDNIGAPPSNTEVDKWLRALAYNYTAHYDRNDFIQFFASRYVYEACMLRLSLSLKQLLDQRAGNNPQLFRSCTFSLRRALEAQASAAALQASSAALQVAQGIAIQGAPAQAQPAPQEQADASKAASIHDTSVATTGVTPPADATPITTSTAAAAEAPQGEAAQAQPAEQQAYTEAPATAPEGEVPLAQTAEAPAYSDQQATAYAQQYGAAAPNQYGEAPQAQPAEQQAYTAAPTVAPEGEVAQPAEAPAYTVPQATAYAQQYGAEDQSPYGEAPQTQPTEQPAYTEAPAVAPEGEVAQPAEAPAYNDPQVSAYAQQYGAADQGQLHQGEVAQPAEAPTYADPQATAYAAQYGAAGQPAYGDAAPQAIQGISPQVEATSHQSEPPANAEAPEVATVTTSETQQS